MCNVALCGGEAENVLSLEKGQLDETTLLTDVMPQRSFSFFFSVIHIQWNVVTAAVFSNMISIDCTVYFEGMKNIFNLGSQTNR